MITWNAFLDYFAFTGEQVKINLAVVLTLALILPRLSIYRIACAWIFQRKTRTLLFWILAAIKLTKSSVKTTFLSCIFALIIATRSS